MKAHGHAGAALFYETLRLHPRIDPDDLARAWSETNPAGLYPLTDYERGAMWILRRLNDTEAEAATPDAFIGPLRRHVNGATARNMLVDAEAAVVVKLLAKEGISVILLKGLARRAAGPLLPCGDARSTTDVDVLVAPGEVDRAWQYLVDNGYRIATDARSPHHAPPLIGAGGVGVELHKSLSHRMNPDEAWRRATDDARDIDWNGIKVRIPAPTELLWHGLSHALQHDTRAWRLRFFLDAACVLAADEPVAWEIIGQRLDDNEVPEQRSPRRWLDAAAQLAGVELPPGIVRNVPRFDVERALRWRLGVLRERKNHGFGGRLLEEGTRRELGVGVAPRAVGTGLYKRARRRIGGLAARVVYGIWRATGERAVRI
ncbi:MAG TPA: nucleotidyltransferase family protein [Gemmatimonadales bacterium]